MNHPSIRPNPVRRPLRWLPLIAAGGFLLAAGAPAAAQNVDLGYKVYKTKIDCGLCHGWAGNGVPDDPRQPKGANLRETTLNREQLIEVIKCGRPGTGMPHFDARAYEDKRCYDSTRADLGDQTPPGWGTSLIGREMEALGDYLMAKVVGQGEITKEQCFEYYGEGAAACAEYPAAQ